jgi:hypothetical protein
VVREFRGQEHCDLCRFSWLDDIAENRRRHAHRHVTATRGVYVEQAEALREGYLTIAPTDPVRRQRIAYDLGSLHQRENRYDGVLVPWPSRYSASDEEVRQWRTWTLVVVREGWAVGHLVMRWRERRGWLDVATGKPANEVGPPGWCVDGIHVLPRLRRAGLGWGLVAEAARQTGTPPPGLLWLWPLSDASKGLLRARSGVERLGLA